MTRKLKHPEVTLTQLEQFSRLTVEDYARATAVQVRVAPVLPWAREIPPSTNRGGNESDGRQEYDLVNLVMTDSGEVLPVSVRKPTHGQVAFIDCLRFTVSEETFHRGSNGYLITDDQMIIEISSVMQRIFGFGVTGKLNGRRDFYTDAWELGDGLGYVALGGDSQRGSVLICIHGTGCHAARNEWESRLYQWLKHRAVCPRITRADLAHDVFAGDYFSVDYADHAFDHGWWRLGGRMPWHEQVGNWRRPDGSGRTLYIGRRKNGKCCRIYEKGKQLGDKHSEWVRVEVELKSNDRVIPFEVLLDPSGYFIGAYPALCVIAPYANECRIPTKWNTTQITIETCLKNIRTSYGAYLRFFRDLLGNDEYLLDLVERTDRGVPDRLKLPNADRYGTPYSPLVCATNGLADLALL